MAIYVMLSRIQPGVINEPKEFKEVARKVSQRIKQDCPGVHWHESYATLGQFDVVDIIESDDIEEVERCAMIIRSLGHSLTETLPATPWRRFLDII